LQQSVAFFNLGDGNPPTRGRGRQEPEAPNRRRANAATPALRVAAPTSSGTRGTGGAGGNFRPY
jgi:hypothetical protein